VSSIILYDVVRLVTLLIRGGSGEN